MQHATSPTKPTAKPTGNPREVEADLLLNAAARLQVIHDGWDRDRADLDAALGFNRWLWSIFAAGATDQDSPLPNGIRQNVANLGLYVFKQTLTVLVDPKPENLVALISINRELAAGLLARD